MYVCRKCSEAPETAWHLFTECPAFARERLEQFFECESYSLPRPEKLRHMVAYTIIWAMSDPPDTVSVWETRHEQVGVTQDLRNVE